MEEEEKEEISREEEEVEEEETKTYIATLIEKAFIEGKEVSKYILKLNEWRTLGSAVSGWASIIVLYGEIEKVELDTKYKYLMSISKTYAIVPKTDFVFLVHTSMSDFGGQLQHDTILYVFSRQTGWKSLHIS